MSYQKHSHYGKIQYWEKRYAENPNPFDWYQNFNTLKDIITQYIKKPYQILNIGCGNSTLSQQMFNQGYGNIMNIDFSTIVIQDMQIKYKNYQQTFQYKYMDVRQLEFQDQTFDIVIDKGTLDSVLCGSYSGQNSKKMFKQVCRVLKSKGYYICVSYGDPEIRIPYFTSNPDCEWSLIKPSPYKVFKPNITAQNVQFSQDPQKNKDYYHYIYIYQKHATIPSPLGSNRRLSGIFGFP